MGALCLAAMSWPGASELQPLSLDLSAAGSLRFTFAIILYMVTLPVAAARAQLSKLVEEAASTHERFEITRNGQRAAVLLGADDYDAMRETIAVLSDAELLRDHLEGLQAIAIGDGMDAAELASMMRTAGRLPAHG